MLTLEDIRENAVLANDIDWDMTPEEAVTLYLEWGNNWSHGNMVKSKDDVSHYFVVNTWEQPPVVALIRRNSDEAVELAVIPVPDDLIAELAAELGNRSGVHGITAPVRKWLQREILE